MHSPHHTVPSTALPSHTQTHKHTHTNTHTHSNQGTIRGAHAGASAAKLTARADQAVAALGVPLTLVYATAATRDACPARKPGAGMWTFYASGGGLADRPTRPPAAPPIDAAASFYCGDAAGRSAGENTAFPAEPDFSDSDRGFAAAAGIVDFRVPEDVFGPAQSLDDFNAHGGGGSAGGGAGGGVRGGAVTGGGGPNAQLASLFRAVAAGLEGFKAIAINRAAAILEGVPTPIASEGDVKGLKGIGEASLAFVSEFLETGDIAAAHRSAGPTPSPAKKAPEGAGALAFA